MLSGSNWRCENKLRKDLFLFQELNKWRSIQSAKHLASLHRTQMVAHDHVNSSFRGSSAFFWLEWTPGTYMVQIFTCKTHTHEKQEQIN